MKRKAAFFDICQTLVWTTTITDFTENFLLSPSQNRRFRVSKWAYHIFYKILRKLRLVSSRGYRDHYAKLFRGYSESDLSELTERYAIRLRGLFKRPIIEKFYELQRAGYDMYLVTAGLDAYLKPFANMLGATLIATELAVDENGVFTGAWNGIDCKGQGKVEKIRARLGDTVDYAASYAFGNDAPDIPMLSLVGNPRAVDPDEKLRHHAASHDWKIRESGPMPKKIMYLITTLHTGGAEVTLHKIAQGITSEKFIPIVVSLQPIREIGIAMRESGIDVRDVGMKSKFHLIALARLFIMLRRERPSVLHTFLSHSNIVGRVIGRAARVPIVISSIRNEYFGGKIRELLIKYTDPLANLTTILSHKAADRVLGLGIVPREKHVIIYNGFDMELFPFQDATTRARVRTDLKIPDDRMMFVSVGSLTKQKGWPHVIDAMKQVVEKKPDAILYIIGAGDGETSLRAQIKECGLEDSVILTGLKSPQQVLEYLNAADAFVLGSLWEGFGNVVVEAMACGLPSIVTDVCGATIAIESGVSGFTVASGDVDELAHAMTMVANLSPQERLVIGRAARASVGKKFSLESMVGQHREIYEKFLEKNN